MAISIRAPSFVTLRKTIAKLSHGMSIVLPWAEALSSEFKVILKSKLFHNLRKFHTILGSKGTCQFTTCFASSRRSLPQPLEAARKLLKLSRPQFARRFARYTRRRWKSWPDSPQPLDHQRVKVTGEQRRHWRCLPAMQTAASGPRRVLSAIKHPPALAQPAPIE